MKTILSTIVANIVFFTCSNVCAAIYVTGNNSRVIQYDDAIPVATPFQPLIASDGFSSNGSGSSLYDSSSGSFDGTDTIFDITFVKTTDNPASLSLNGELRAKEYGAFGGDLVDVRLEHSSGVLFSLGIGPYSDGDLDGTSSLVFSETLSLAQSGEYHLVIRTTAFKADFGNEVGSSYSFSASLSGDSFAVLPVPSAFWLLGSALIGVVSLNRRTSK